jgi:hypothetical protein
MDNHYTYTQKRSCLHCQKTIADQTHASTKFCERIELPDRTIQSCKDDYHSARNKEKNKHYKKLADFHKDMNRRINNLLKAKGEIVTVALIDQYGIILHKPAAFFNDNNKSTYYFIDFAFKQINLTQFKIITHGNEF